MLGVGYGWRREKIMGECFDLWVEMSTPITQIFGSVS
jgi:hypothetical protein